MRNHVFNFYSINYEPLTNNNYARVVTMNQNVIRFMVKMVDLPHIYGGRVVEWYTRRT